MIVLDTPKCRLELSAVLHLSAGHTKPRVRPASDSFQSNQIVPVVALALAEVCCALLAACAATGAAACYMYGTGRLEGAWHQK